MLRLLVVLSVFFAASAKAETQPHSGDKPLRSVIDNTFKSLGGKLRGLGGEDIPLDDESWSVLECLSDGTCKYYNRKTGEIRLVRNKDAPKPPAAEPAPAPADPAVQPASHEEPGKAELTEEEKEALAEPNVADLAAFKKRVALAQRAGKKYLVLQVGNLEGCPPCQQINRQLQESPLAKDESIAFVDFNYLKGGEDMKKLLHKMQLPSPFPFPYVYLLEIDQARDPFNDKGEWRNRYGKLDRDRAMNVNNVVSTIEWMRKNPPKPAEKK